MDVDLSSDPVLHDEARGKTRLRVCSVSEPQGHKGFLRSLQIPVVNCHIQVFMMAGLSAKERVHPPTTVHPGGHADALEAVKHF